MNKQYHAILASDLDGTLLCGKDQLSRENYEAIKALDEMGICFAPCSGRTLTEMPQCILEHPSIRYYICADGASVYDKKLGKHEEICLDRDTLKKVMSILGEYRHLSSVRSHGVSYVDEAKHAYADFKQHRVSDNYVDFILYSCCAVRNFECLVHHLEGVEMICSFFESDEEMAECRKRLLKLDGIAVASSEPTNIEIYHTDAGKGNGVLRLADMLAVPHERTYAVGDSENDVDMIKKAGVSLAMKNASDELKALADHTICHYTEHSAKYILEHFFQ